MPSTVVYMAPLYGTVTCSVLFEAQRGLYCHQQLCTWHRYVAPLRVQYCLKHKEVSIAINSCVHGTVTWHRCMAPLHVQYCLKLTEVSIAINSCVHGTVTCSVLFEAQRGIYCHQQLCTQHRCMAPLRVQYCLKLKEVSISINSCVHGTVTCSVLFEAQRGIYCHQ